MKRFIDRINCLYSNHLNEIMIIGFIMFMIPAIISNTPMFKENQSVIDSVARVLLALTRWSSLGLMATKVLIDVTHKKIYLPLCIGLGTLSLITIFSTNNLEITKFFLLMLFIKDCDYKRYIRLNVIIQFGFVLFILFMVSLGLIDNVMLDRVRLRFTIGFDWVTYLPILFFFLITMLVIYIERSFTNIEFVLLLMVTTLLFIFTNTRMAFIFSLIVIIFGRIKNSYLVKKIHLNQIAKKLLIYLPFVFLILTIFLSYLYSPSISFWKPIDSLLSGRLTLMNKAINNYGLTLFGQNIQWIGYGQGAIKGVYNFVDNSYLKIILDYGIITTIIILGIYGILLKRSIEEDNKSILFTSLLVLCLCFFEPYLINLSFNVMPMLAGILLVHSQKDLNIKKWLSALKKR